MKAFYETQSRQIDRIQTESLQISSRENPYDVFICYKRMETDEKRTADARIAADYYKELTQRGYKVFFAELFHYPVFLSPGSFRTALSLGEGVGDTEPAYRNGHIRIGKSGNFC